MSDRYFVEPRINGPTVVLRDAEAHHLTHVMRAKPGQQVLLFDGSGDEFTARVERIGRSEVDLQIIERRAANRESLTPLTVAVALPKLDRQRWLVEKAVELGVTRLLPLATTRSSERASESGMTRLRRAVVEASKQCGRNHLMEIGEPQSVDEFLRAASPDALRLIAHPRSKPCREVLEDVLRKSGLPGGVVVAVGPEGGFTAAEVDTATAAGWQAVGLGPRILRIETAALALVALIEASLPSQ
jgi:16S rRNA (uracil1498-N3)-methyltransferase